LHGDTISFIYNANYITVGYTGLSYKNPGNIRYRYRMEGLDSNWVYTAYTSAQFQALAPGNYRFIVYAQNGGGHWSDHPAVLRLHIIPVWWQTWTFRLAVVLAVLALLYAVARSRIAAVRKREHEKAELHARVVTTELKALRAQMNPHFVFNAINSVQHFITSNDPKSSQRYLAKFAKLIRYVVDNSKLTTIPLEKELEALQLFLDLESLRFENKFDYSIHVDKRIDRHFIRVPSMLIQPYVENAIWHGLMHKKEKGRIDLRVELLETGLLCTVEDNGIGRKRSLALKQSLGKETHASVGMAITQDRLEIINQLHHSHLNVKVIDLKDEKGEAAGTRVELFIPFH
jgi:LytS/YehU family sensor histidine kinase